jgi:hypothetical protein
VFYEVRVPTRDRSMVFGRRARKIARFGDVEICLLGRAVRTLAWAVILTGVLVAGTLFDHWVVLGPVAGVLTFLWSARSVRVIPMVVAGGGFWIDGPDEGGAGVREPRRPLPDLPCGAVALPVP